MQAIAVNSSVVRDRFSETIDTVIRKGPKVVQRRRDTLMMVNLEHLAVVLDAITITGTVEQDEEGVFIATCNEIDDLFGSGETASESLESLALELIEYSTEFLHERFDLYFHAPNRKKHLPYVFKVMLQHNVQEVINLIRVEHERA